MNTRGWGLVVAFLVIVPGVATAQGNDGGLASQLPPVATPALPAPVPALPVPVPTVPVPVPTVPVPVPTVPTVPALPAPSGGGPAVPPAPTAPAPAPGVSAGAPSSGRVPGQAPGPSAASGAARGGSSQASTAAPASRSSGSAGGAGFAPRVALAPRQATKAEVERRDRRLRKMVRRLRGCLDALSPLQRRVLVLRSGVGPREAKSRERVASLLDRSETRIAKAERRGLRSLRRADREGTCGDGPSSLTAPDGDESAGAQLTSGAALGTGAAGTGETLADTGAGAEGDSESGGGGSNGRSGVKGESDEAEPSIVSAPGALALRGTDITLPLLALLLVAGAIVMWRVLKRQPGEHETQQPPAS